jgi:hypothetical protein
MDCMTAADTRVMNLLPIVTAQTVTATNAPSIQPAETVAGVSSATEGFIAALLEATSVANGLSSAAPILREERIETFPEWFTPESPLPEAPLKTPPGKAPKRAPESVTGPAPEHPAPVAESASTPLTPGPPPSTVYAPLREALTAQQPVPDAVYLTSEPATVPAADLAIQPEHLEDVRSIKVETEHVPAAPLTVEPPNLSIPAPVLDDSGQTAEAFTSELIRAGHDPGIPQASKRDASMTSFAPQEFRSSLKPFAVADASAGKAGGNDASKDHRGTDGLLPDQPIAPAVAPAPEERFVVEMSEVAPAEKTPSAEQPWTPLPQIARRVAIEIGDDERGHNVRITLHERSGDISIKFDTGTEALRSELQSSAGTLIETLRRENVSILNLDFSNTLGGTSDSGRGSGGQTNRPKAPRKALGPIVEVPALLDTVNIRV